MFVGLTCLFVGLTKVCYHDKAFVYLTICCHNKLCCFSEVLFTVQGIQSSNISIYDSFSGSWRCVDSLSSPRAGVAVATIDAYSIIVIGGYTKGHSTTAAKLSSLPTVEIGQAELA